MNLFVYFIIFAVFGVAYEVFWVSVIDSISTGNPRLKGRSSLWMFPIYGGVLFIVLLVHYAFPGYPWWFKGVMYSALILVWEYLSGALVRWVAGVAPWDYGKETADGVGSPKRYNIDGLICLDYVPVWFFSGLLAEAFFVFLQNHLFL